MATRWRAAVTSDRDLTRDGHRQLGPSAGMGRRPPRHRTMTGCGEVRLRNIAAPAAYEARPARILPARGTER